MSNDNDLLGHLLQYLENSQKLDTKDYDVQQYLLKRRNMQEVDVLCVLNGHSPLWACWINLDNIMLRKTMRQLSIVDLQMFNDTQTTYQMFQPIHLIFVFDSKNNSIFGTSGDADINFKQKFPVNQFDSRFEKEPLLNDVNFQQHVIDNYLQQNFANKGIEAFNMIAAVQWGTTVSIEKLIFLPNALELLKIYICNQNSKKEIIDQRMFKNISQIQQEFVMSHKDQPVSLFCGRYLNCPLVTGNSKFYSQNILSQVMLPSKASMLKSVWFYFHQLSSNRLSIFSNDEASSVYADLIFDLIKFNQSANFLFIGRSNEDFIKQLNLKLKSKLLQSMQHQNSCYLYNMYMPSDQISFINDCIKQIISRFVYIKAVNIQEVVSMFSNNKFSYMIFDGVLDVSEQTLQFNCGLRIFILHNKYQIQNNSFLHCLSGSDTHDINEVFMFEISYLSLFVFDTTNPPFCFNHNYFIKNKQDQTFGAYVLKFDLSLQDHIRIRMFLDLDPSFSRLVLDDKKTQLTICQKRNLQKVALNQYLYSSVANYHLAHLLKHIHLQVAAGERLFIETEEMHCHNFNEDLFDISQFRAKMIKMHLKSVILSKQRSILLVVPQMYFNITRKFLQNSFSINLSFSLLNIAQSNELFSIILLSDVDLYVYQYMFDQNQLAIQIDLLPKMILFPFVSTRPMEFFVDRLYEQFGIYPVINLVVAQNSIESYLLEYKQKFNFLIVQEYNQYVNFAKVKQVGCKYDELINCFGDFLCDQLSQQNSVENYEQQIIFNKYSKDLFTNSFVSNYIHADIIIQAALNDTFHISKDFDLNLLVCASAGSQTELLNFDAQKVSSIIQSQISVEKTNGEKGDICFFNAQFFYWNMQNCLQLEKSQIAHMFQQYSLANTLYSTIQNQDIFVRLQFKHDQESVFECLKGHLLYQKTAQDRLDIQYLSTSNERRKGSMAFQKSFLSLPIFSVPQSQNRNAYSIYGQKPIEQNLSLCCQCGPEIVWSGKCDICGESMIENPNHKLCFPNSIKYQIEPQQVLFDLTELIGSRNSRSMPVFVDFLTNQKLSNIGYIGAQRFDQIIVQPLYQKIDQQLLLDILGQLKILAQPSKPGFNIILYKQLLAAVFSLIFEYRFFTQQNMTKKYVYQQNLSVNNNLWLQSVSNLIVFNQLNQIQGLDIKYATYYLALNKKIFNYVCPFHLFSDFQIIQSNDPSTLNFESRNIRNLGEQADFILNSCTFIEKNKLFNSFFRQFVENQKLIRIAQIYSRQNQSLLFIQVINKCLNNFNESYDLKQLLSSTIFYSNNIINDSYLVLAVLSNIFDDQLEFPIQFQLQGLLGVDIQNYLNLSGLHKFHKCCARNISFTNQLWKYFETPEVDQLVNIILTQNDSAALSQLFSLQWDPLFGSLNCISLDFGVSQHYNQNLINTFQVHQFLLSRGIESSKKIPESSIFVKEENKFNDPSQNQRNFIPQQNNYQKPAIKSAAMAVVTNQQQNQYLVTQSQIVKIANNNMHQTNSNFHQSTQPIMPQFQPKNFVERIINNFLYQKQTAMQQSLITKRLMDHFNSKCYYSKCNLLYIPSVIILEAEEALKLIYGQNIPDNKQFSKLNQNQIDVAQPDYQKLFNVIFEDYVFPEQQNNYKNLKPSKSALQLLSQIQKPDDIQGIFNKFSDLDKWVFRKMMLSQFADRQMIVFKQDPVVGCSHDQVDILYGQKVNSSQKYSKCCDSYRDQQFTKDAAKKEATELRSFCLQLLKEDQIKKIIHNFVKLGFSIGSTPADIFANHIKDLDSSQIYEQVAVLSSVMKLLLLSDYHQIDFPFSVEKLTSTKEEIKKTIQRLEHMRLINMKVFQFEYVQFLHRVNPKQNGSSTLKSEQQILIDEFLRLMVNSNVQVFHHDYMKSIPTELNSAYKQLIQKTEMIDNQNKQMWIVENQFIDFIGKKKDSANKDLKLLFLSSFSINDFDKFGIRTTWKVAVALKFVFILLFTGEANINGQKIQLKTFAHLCDHYKLSEQQKSYIQELHNEILNIWSRLQDYLFLRLIIDFGFTEKLMQAVNGQSKIDDIKQQQKIDVLISSTIISDSNFIQNSALCKYFFKLKDATNQEDNQYQWIYQLLKTNLKNMQSGDQVYIALQSLMQDCPNPRDAIFNKSANQNQIQQRAESLAKALRVERILQVDPLQLNIKDKAIGDLIERRVIRGPIDERSFHQHVPNPVASLPPPIQIPFMQNINTSVQSYQESFIQAQQTTPPSVQVNHSHHRPAVQPVVQERTRRQRRNDPPAAQGTQMDQILLDDRLSQKIQQQSLAFYQRPKEEIESFIRQIVTEAHCEEQLSRSSFDAFLFVQSSCQRSNSEVWGRLYSFYIRDEPIDLQQSIDSAKQAKDKLLEEGRKLFPRIETDVDVIKQLQQVIFQNQQQHQDLCQFAQQYVQSYLNIAYNHAFYMRSEYIQNQNSQAIDRRRQQIHIALKQMQFMQQIPLNLIIQGDSSENKRKMALATYFFLCVKNDK